MKISHVSIPAHLLEEAMQRLTELPFHRVNNTLVNLKNAADESYLRQKENLERQLNDEKPPMEETWQK